MKKLTKKDYKEIAINLDLSRLWEDIEESIDRYCDDNKIKPPTDPMIAMEKVYEYLTNQNEKPMGKKLARDKVISSTDKGDLVGVYWKGTDGVEILFECSPKKADKIIKIFNED